MDLLATQIYDNEDFASTQKISYLLEEEESVQVGTLSIESTDYSIKTGTTKIGRLSSCDIIINDATVSKLHAEIEASKGQGSIWISDLNSSNKTKLNNLILRPTRLYELKNGSVIEFGRVRAIYRTYPFLVSCPAENTVIPETPAPPRQKIASTIIPNTPDSSLNNSSRVDDDGSIILGTQKDDENSIFRRPQIPQQCQSTNIDKKNISMNESNDSQIAILNTSVTTENQVSIFDAETQKFEEEYKMAPKSIHDVETQGVSIEISEHLVEDAKTGKQLSELNIHDETDGRSVDIHDIETQDFLNDNEMEIQKSKINIQNITRKKFTINIHTKKTQDYIDDTNESDSDTQKFEIGKNNGEKNVAQVRRDIHDLKAQKFNNEYIAEDVSETQLEVGARCEQNRNISDMETQFVTDTANNDRANKDKDKDNITDITKSGINHENITKSPKSRSSSPGFLNLSSPEVEDCPSSPLNQSGHLLESSYLLDFFGEGIDKQEKMKAFNMSTPKLMKVSERNSNVKNVRNAVNNKENNVEDIFEAPTQRIHKFEALMSDDSETNEEDTPVVYKVPKKKCGKPQSQQTNDDSETDAEEYIAELAKKQHESSETLTNLSNKDINNGNDPGTSIESEDMFDVLTQRLDDNSTTKNTSDSLINQPQKTNEVNRAIDDTELTQVINTVDLDHRAKMPDVNDAMPTQLILSHDETCSKTVINSKDFATKNNQNDVDDIVDTLVINAKSVDCSTTENGDCENIDYELAPTQVIDEIEDRGKRNSTCERGDSTSQINLNDSLEKKLDEMFDNINTDTNNIHESPHMSTQCLEDILKSSQCDSTDKSIINNQSTDSVSRKQAKRKNHASCNQHSHNLPSTEVNANVNEAETNSQNSNNFSIATRQKRNISKDRQEFIEKGTPHQNINSSPIFEANEKTMDNDIGVEFNKKRKRISKTKNKSTAIMEILNNNNRNEIISSESNMKNLRNCQSSKLLRQEDEVASETSKQILKRDSAKLEVNDVEENTSICIPCPSVGQRAQILDTLYEANDDILMRLPAVRISGTLSNPASPSASSTSSVYSTRFKQGIARSKQKKYTFLRGKSLCEQNIKSLEKNDELSNCHSNSVLGTSTVKISNLVDTSEDSETDSETKYKRFQQIAERMLGKELSCLKRQNKRSRKKKYVSSNVSEDPKQSTDIESNSLTRINSRTTRHYSRQSDLQTSIDHQREVRVKNIAPYGDKSIEPETKSTVVKRKKSSNMVEENVEQILKRCKTAEVTEKCSVSTRGRKSIVKTANESNKKNKPAQTKEMEAHVNRSQDKVLRVLLNPIKSLIGNESQEVEKIMAKGPSNAQDKNLSIRDSSKAKIFQRELRTRRRKRSNSDIEPDSVLTESGMSSEIGDSDNTRLYNPVPKTKRGRCKNSISLVPEVQVSKKKEIFKKPIKKTTSLIFDSSSAENMIGESQDSSENDASTSSRVSRSRTASIRKEKELNQEMYKLNASGQNTSVEITPLSTPSRIRRSTSILSNTTSSAMKHKVLFTGITEDYSKIIKILGGSKVEDPAKCTILVTDKVRRTYKFLCALAKGIPIVTTDWLRDSETAARFIDWENYILKDPAAEAKFGFRLRKSLDKAKEKKLLDSYTIILTSSVAPPPIEELKDMISSCGGKALLRPPTKWPEKAVVLSREEDLPNARRFLAKAPKTVTVQSTEFILTGILKQETDFDKYKLT